MIAVPAHTKYQIIQEMVQREGNLLNITWLCDSADVARSGYYHYLETEERRLQREEHDQQDFAVIVKAYQYRGVHKGARSIYMRLLHLNPPVNMNLKKIRRLMKKYGLRCPIRKANPYRRMAKAIETAAVAPNLLNREFELSGSEVGVCFSLEQSSVKQYRQAMIECLIASPAESTQNTHRLHCKASCGR